MNGGEMIGMITSALMMMIPIVWILTKHQQKMTTLIRGEAQQSESSIDLKRELASLRELVSQQTIAIDNISRSQTELRAAMAANEELKQRIGQ